MVDITLPSLTLSADEKTILSRLRANIVKFSRKNAVKHEYYEGKKKVQQLGIAIPTEMRELAVSVSWPGTVVDVLEERLHWQGWTSPTGTPSYLDEAYQDNWLQLESSRVHLESLITGTGFVAVGKGDPALGEPEVLITVESSSQCTAEYDYRTRRISAALSQTYDDTGVVMETLYLPNETVMLARAPRRRTPEVVGRNPHNFGRVMLARLRNRDRALDLEGRSELTHPILYYTDAACRTLMGLEVNREFYQAPQRFAVNAEPEMFGLDSSEGADRAENIRRGWDAAMGRLNVIPPNEDGETPILDQYPVNPPTPFLDQVKMYSQMVSEASGIPATNFGFVTENPPSADSIRQAEYRLATRAERRQTLFGQAWKEVAYLVTLVREGKVDRDEFRKIQPKWRDPFTPTRAAAADEALKLTSAGILPPDSGVTYDRIGLTEQEQARLAEDKRKANAAAIVQSIRDKAQSASPEAQQLAARQGSEAA